MEFLQEKLIIQTNFLDLIFLFTKFVDGTLPPRLYLELINLV